MKHFIFAMTIFICGTAFSQVTNPTLAPANFVVQTRPTESLEPTERANRLVASAELLMTNVGIEAAYSLLQEALRLDRSNLKAQFYLLLLRPRMSLKGILYRLKDLEFDLGPEAERSYMARVKRDRNISAKHHFDFYYSASRPPFRNENEIQDLAMSLAQQSESILAFLRANDISGMKLRMGLINGYALDLPLSPLNGILAIPLSIDMGAVKSDGSKPAPDTDCKVVLRQTEVIFQNCDFYIPQEYTVNKADILLIQQNAASTAMWMNLLSAYNLLGTYAIFSEFGLGDASDFDRMSYFDFLQGAGKLVAPERIQRAKQLAKQSVSKLRPLLTHNSRRQIQIAHRRSAQDSNADSVFDISFRSVLTPNRFARLESFQTKSEHLDDLETVLNNGMLPFVTRPIDVNTSVRPSHTISVKWGQFLETPPMDIRELLPSEFGPCGRALKLKDPTWSGMVPSGRADDVARDLGLIGHSCNY